MRPILHYVHHQGGGHWRRALALAEQLSRPVIFASSTAPPRALPGSGHYLRLPPDFSAEESGDSYDNPHAHGRLHWAPVHQAGLLDRHRLLLDAVAGYRPALAVVDVSVEVAVILRASGVPVIAVRLPGRRSDPAHQLGFGLADEVVMPVPAAWGLHTGHPRTHAVGLVAAEPIQAIRPIRPIQAAEPGNENEGRRTAVVLVGTGGSRLDAAACVQIALELPDHDVQVLGPDRPAKPSARPGNLTFRGRVSDPRRMVHAASVVIGNTGLGTVGDVASAGRPFVTLPEDRSFGEQLVTADALERQGAAVVLRQVPLPGGWADAVKLAESRGNPELRADGAQRFARLVESRADSVAGPVSPSGVAPRETS